nr:eIF-2-alpha kinase activator GCN1 isoform X12 [Ipomoea batatas]
MQCILEWSQRSKDCPICSRQVFLEDAASQELLAAVENERNARSSGCKSHWLSYKGNGRRKLLRLGSLVVRYSEITVLTDTHPKVQSAGQTALQQVKQLLVLLNPIPEVRSVAARAIGSLVRLMGEENFSDWVPWLLDTLK